MSEAQDIEIIALAQKEQRMVVTLDADFHAHLAVSEAVGPSVLRIRMEGQKAEHLSPLIINVLSIAKDEINQGAMITLAKGKVHIKLLPISK